MTQVSSDEIWHFIMNVYEFVIFAFPAQHYLNIGLGEHVCSVLQDT